ncbi:hypothetical protein [Spirosoma koreense]
MILPRKQKMAALQQALTGNAEPLQQLKAQRGRLYTEAELAEIHRQWQTINPSASPDESLRLFGRYAPIPGKAYAMIDFGDGLFLYAGKP